MTDQNAIRDDIAFMRALAEEGNAGPLAGGSILVACGLIYGAASLVTWRLLSEGKVTNGLIFPLIWFGATAIFLVCLRILKARARGTGGGAARATGVAWMTSGWVVFAIVISLMIFAGRTNNWLIMAALPSLILAIYGGAWMLGAILSKRRWVFGVAAGSFAMAFVNAWWALDYANLYLIFAVSLVGLLAAPGLIMMRQARPAA
jgi:hypothetical protein